MITVPTVFVLGAGASAPYGLPLGIQLRLDIFKNYTMDTDRSVHLFNTTKFRRPDIDKFVDALRYSGLLSVDAFLERRPEFMEIGKSMMGVELLHGEVHDRLWQDGSNWLTYLYSSMVGSSLDEFLNNKVSFITFNYDRSVEHFLYISLKNSFGRSSQDTAGAMRSIPIVHLHGRLGYLPWQAGNNGISFGDNQIDGRKMDILQKEIKVVHEELTDGRDKDFDEAKALLHQATRVYLLGFGFGARNVERIGLAEIQPSQFVGTAYGMTGKEVAQCKALCGNRPVLFESLLALEFLRTVAMLD